MRDLQITYQFDMGTCSDIDVVFARSDSIEREHMATNTRNVSHTHSTYNSQTEEISIDSTYENDVSFMIDGQ